MVATAVVATPGPRYVLQIRSIEIFDQLGLCPLHPRKTFLLVAEPPPPNHRTAEVGHTRGEGSRNLDYMAWPRGCALAEVGWSGEGRGRFRDFRQRLAKRLEDRKGKVKVPSRGR